MSFEAYTVAVVISLRENVSRGLGLMAQHFKKTDAQAKILQDRMASIGKMTLIGGAIAGAGILGLDALKPALDEAKKYQTEMAKIDSLGLGAGVTAHADKFAKAAHIVGNSARDMAKSYGDALAVFKRTDEADIVAPLLAKAKFANQGMYGEAGKDNDNALMGLLKTVEFRGGTKSTDEAKKQFDYAQKVVNASRGRVDGAQMLQALKTGGIPLKLMSDKAFYLNSEPLIQEMGGFRFGTGTLAAYNNLFMGRGSMQSQQELYRLGLLDKDKVQFNKLGMVQKVLPGAMKGQDVLLNEGWLTYLQKVILPAFAKSGITKDADVQNEIQRILSNSRNNILGTVFQQREKMAMQTAANAKAAGLDQSVAIARNTALGKQIDLEAKEATLKQHIGEAILPLYVRALEMTADALDRVNYFAEAYPNLFKDIVIGFAGLSVLAVVGGGIMLITAAFEALGVVAGLINGGALAWLVETALPAMAGAIGAVVGPIAEFVIWAGAGGLGIIFGGMAAAALLVWNNWKEISTALGDSLDDVKHMFSAIFHGDILDAVKDFGGLLLTQLQTVLNTVIAGINVILPKAITIPKFGFANDYKDHFNIPRTVDGVRANQQLASDPIFAYFRQKGIRDDIAFGIRAGIAAEGGGLGMAANGAFGIGQWRGDRLKHLFAQYGTAPGLQQQLDFMMVELKGGDRGGPSVLASRNAQEALSNYIGGYGWGFMRPSTATSDAGRNGDMHRGDDFLSSHSLPSPLPVNVVKMPANALPKPLPKGALPKMAPKAVKAANDNSTAANKRAAIAADIAMRGYWTAAGTATGKAYDQLISIIPQSTKDIGTAIKLTFGDILASIHNVKMVPDKATDDKFKKFNDEHGHSVSDAWKAIMSPFHAYWSSQGAVVKAGLDKTLKTTRDHFAQIGTAIANVADWAINYIKSHLGQMIPAVGVVQAAYAAADRWALGKIAEHLREVSNAAQLASKAAADHAKAMHKASGAAHAADAAKKALPPHVIVHPVVIAAHKASGAAHAAVKRKVRIANAWDRHHHAEKNRLNAVRPQNVAVNVTSNTYLDSKLIASKTAKHLADAANRPTATGGRFDPNMSQLHPAQRNG